MKKLLNFWVEGTIDGRKNEIIGGPRSSTGGMEFRFYVTEDGSSRRAVTIKAYPGKEGRLHYEVEHDGITEILTYGGEDLK